MWSSTINPGVTGITDVAARNVAYVRTELEKLKRTLAESGGDPTPSKARLPSSSDTDLVAAHIARANAGDMRAAILQVPEFLTRRDRYAAVFYQIGNHYRHHAYMLPCMGVAPGILVLHDYCLQYLMLGATLLQGNLDAVEDALRAAIPGLVDVTIHVEPEEDEEEGL